jgi:hypothetical protein
MNIFKDKGLGFCRNTFLTCITKKKKKKEIKKEREKNPVDPSCLEDFSNWQDFEQALLRALRFYFHIKHTCNIY